MNKSREVEIEVTSTIPAPESGSALCLCVFEDGSLIANTEFDGLLKSAMRNNGFKGEVETISFFHAVTGDNDMRRVCLIGCGAVKDLTPHVLRRAAASAVRRVAAAGIRHIHFVLPQSPDEIRMARAVSEGAILGSYDGGLFKNEVSDDVHVERFTIVCDDSSDGLRRAVLEGRIVSESANWTRMLSDMPGRDLPPQEFARRAAEMAEEFGLTVESLDVGQIQERGMGGLLGVGKGSDQPPALIVLRYEPDDADTDDLWAFVGKGITFDTGGISLKHGPDMYEMKADMAGGAAVLGAMRAIAAIKPRQKVIGIVPAAENMPSGRAIKPGDVIKTLAGYTIEVVDTDAEGRLVLVDGIAYAKQLGASRIVDLATLTGSIIVALGDHRSGLFSNNDEWANQVTAAADRAGEPVWRMPVSDDYKKRIESEVADFKNYGGRPDATGAALLLSKFALETPWVHLDIAGTSWYDESQPYAPKGSSGTGVRTLVELVCSPSNRSSGLT